MLDPEKIVRDNKKVSSQRLSSSFPLELTSSAFDHPPSFFLLSRIARPTIDRFSRIIDSTLRREELGQSSSTAHHNFRLTRLLFILSISSSQKLPPFCKLPSLTAAASSSSFVSSPSFTFLFVAVVVVVALFYFSSYSHAQFCVLLPPVTLAENNNKICSLPLVHGRRWGSAMPCSSYSPFPRFFNLCLSRSFLNFFSFVFISHFFRMQKLAMNRARRRQMFLNLTKEIFS